MANALQGAKFKLENKEAGFEYECTLNTKLLLPDLPEGDYQYSLSKKGYETTKGEIHIAKRGNFNLKLSLNKKETKKPKSKKQSKKSSSKKEANDS